MGEGCAVEVSGEGLRVRLEGFEAPFEALAALAPLMAEGGGLTPPEGVSAERRGEILILRPDAHGAREAHPSDRASQDELILRVARGAPEETDERLEPTEPGWDGADEVDPAINDPITESPSSDWDGDVEPGEEVRSPDLPQAMTEGDPADEAADDAAWPDLRPAADMQPRQGPEAEGHPTASTASPAASPAGDDGAPGVRADADDEPSEPLRPDRGTAAVASPARGVLRLEPSLRVDQSEPARGAARPDRAITPRRVGPRSAA